MEKISLDRNLIEIYYYIPKIEQFIEGFEYEIYSEGYSEESVEDFCGWYSYKFMQNNCWRSLEDIKYLLEYNPQYIRAKIVMNLY